MVTKRYTIPNNVLNGIRMLYNQVLHAMVEQLLGWRYATITHALTHCITKSKLKGHLHSRTMMDRDIKFYNLGQPS